ncbi:MAG TPA: zinc ABC transporter substrate-binding protein [Smithellaceae bacterium]|nr:zinc ABC transporter substrate-binding protein [Smithellaceae bacterium]
MNVLKKFSFYSLCFFLTILWILLSTSLALAENEIIIVASTSWVGAIAEAAGADEVRILAPFELKHPPEYDYRPSDIAQLRSARLLVYGGYEPFVKKLAVAARLPRERMIVIVTSNDPDNLKKQARFLAEKMGTQKREADWEKALNKALADIQKQAKKNKISQKRVLVQKYQVPLVKWLGFDVIGAFNTDELSPNKVMEYAMMKPDMVIDNFHNPQGKPIAEIAKCDYVAIINFPSANARSLIELLKENATKLGIKK